MHQINGISFVTEHVGHMHLSQNKWEIQYTLNLSEYKETTDLLQQCVDTLTTACENGQNRLCPYFLHETKNLKTALQADYSKMSTLSRQKRLYQSSFVPIIIGVAALSFWGGILYAKTTLESLKDRMEANIDLIEQAANMTLASLKLQEDYIKEADERFSKIETTLNNNTISIELYTQFFSIIGTVLFMVHKHEKNSEKIEPYL